MNVLKCVAHTTVVCVLISQRENTNLQTFRYLDVERMWVKFASWAMEITFGSFLPRLRSIFRRPFDDAA